jgi:hypothetical protein
MGVACPPNLVQPDSLYAELETLTVVATVARKWAGGTLPKLLWGRSLLYSCQATSGIDPLATSGIDPLR